MGQLMRFILCWILVAIFAGCGHQAVRSGAGSVQPALSPSALYRPIDLWSFHFDFDGKGGTVNDVPQEVRELDGRMVVIDGLMMSWGGRISTSEFAVTAQEPPNIGPAPGVETAVLCRTPPDRPVASWFGRVRVYGRFRIAIEREDGIVVQLFVMDVDRVELLSGPKG
jgi:hypothetical protein